MNSKKKEQTSIDDKSESDEIFAYEVSSDPSDGEKIEEIQEEEVVEEPPPRKTIKIISEKDMEIKECPPPNYSPYLKCFLHYKNSKYKVGRMLKLKEIQVE